MNDRAEAEVTVTDAGGAPSLLELIEQASTRASGIAYEGFTRPDDNIPGNLLLVESQAVIYSFPTSEIVLIEPAEGGRSRVIVRVGAAAFRTSQFVVGLSESFVVGMEDIAPPAPPADPSAPQAAQGGIAPPSSAMPALLASLAAVGANYNGKCAGGDSYQNNCAHFLSDAFIRAGYSELLPNNSHINARCGAAKRPIRAREMWSWFKSKARRTSRTVQRNTGWWAVFQLDESAYWGGHVVLLDSNRWYYYGTGWYKDWDQYLYQW